MANTDNRDNRKSQGISNPEKSGKPGLRIAIIVLAVLVVLSAGGLAARYVYLNVFAPNRATATVPDNLIGDGDNTGENAEGTSPSSSTQNAPAGTSSPATSEDVSASDTEETDRAVETSADGQTQTAPAGKPEAAVLELYQGHTGDNERFEVRDMLPGDIVTKYFCIRARHKNALELFFRTDITKETKSLGNVLQIRVTCLDTGKVLYDGPFAGADGQEFSELLAENTQGETVAYYQIDVSLDTSVGNEYQQAGLTADFEWYIKEEGSLEPPPTGVTADLALWTVLAAASLVLAMLLIRIRRKEGDRHEQAE